MGGINSKKRKKLYRFLVDRYGELCHICGKKPSEVQLVIDHKDNNSKNNHFDNLQLLCRGCNYFKNPRREPFDVGERVRVDESIRPPTSIEKNIEIEPKFLHCVEELLEKNESVMQKDDLIDSTAYVIGASPTTTARYLRKYCSSVGPFELVRDGKITLVRKKQKII